MSGILIVILSVVAVAYLIIKKYYATWSLLTVGLVTLTIAGLMGATLVTGKQATHLFAFDVVQVFSNLLSKRTAGLGMNIMVMGGFSVYMARLGATRALVNVCVKPLSAVKAPYLIMALAYILGQFLNIVLTSAVGLALLLMVTMYPLLIAAGANKKAAAATIALTGALGLGPTGGNNLLIAQLSGKHVMEVFLDYQMFMAVFMIPTIALAHLFVMRYFDKKDIAAGRITDADYKMEELEDKSKDAKDAPSWYAVLPLIPLILLFVFSPIVYKGVKLSVVSAIVVSVLIAFVIDLLRNCKPKESFAKTKAFFEGMGKVFTSTVALIICAEVFAAGLTKSGGIAALIEIAKTSGGGCFAVFTVMFVITLVSTFLMGSGNAAFFSFAPMVPAIAKSFGANLNWFLQPLQICSGPIRSMSPIAGCVIAIAGLSGVSPFEIVRRTAPSCLLAALVGYCVAFFLI